MEHLLFNNPVFNTGRNITVRRGIKWAVADEGEFGFPISDTLNPWIIIGFAKNPKKMIFRFCDLLHTELLKLEHDPGCRTYIGLKTEMETIYNGFNEFEIVTVIEFDFDKV